MTSYKKLNNFQTKINSVSN